MERGRRHGEGESICSAIGAPVCVGRRRHKEGEKKIAAAGWLQSSWMVWMASGSMDGLDGLKKAKFF